MLYFIKYRCSKPRSEFTDVLSLFLSQRDFTDIFLPILEAPIPMLFLFCLQLSLMTRICEESDDNSNNMIVVRPHWALSSLHKILSAHGPLSALAIARADYGPWADNILVSG